MFYILLCLQSECYGMDIMKKVHTMTGGRVSVGPGTLYNLLESFAESDMIRETKVEGRRRSYRITDAAYQLYRRDGAGDEYIVCWDNRIVYINFDEIPTAGQIAVAVEKLSK